MQAIFAELAYRSQKLTWQDRFLAELEAVTPWSELLGVLKPYYPKGAHGRPPIGLE